VHPLHDESAAEAFTVAPFFPLLLNPQADNSFITFSLLQKEHSGFSLPNKRSSKLFPQSLQ